MILPDPCHRSDHAGIGVSEDFSARTVGLASSDVTVIPAAATAADRPRILGSLVAAFVRDPALRFMFPEDDVYAAHAPAFFGGLFDRRVRAGTVWTVDGLAAALWDGPAAHPASDPVAVPPVVSAASAPGGIGGPADPEDLPDAVRARIDSYDAAVEVALPDGPFWYLGVLGTHPDAAGRGFARALLAAGVARAAADGLSAVLETSNERNLRLYRSAGFEVARAVTRPVPVWIMVNAAGDAAR